MQSPEADTSAPSPPPISIYTHKNCLGGPYIDVTQLSSTIEDTSLVAVTKKLISDILGASNKPETILARLGNLRGEEMSITHNDNTFTIKLPVLVKNADLTNVFNTLGTTLGCCQHLFSLDSTQKECSNCEHKPPPVKKKPPAELEAATSTTLTDTPLAESPVASLNKMPTQEWGIEEVIQFIESADPCLGVHADLFRKHVRISNNRML